MFENLDLTYEQQFQQRAIQYDIDKLTLPEAKALLAECTKLNMLKDNVIRELTRKVLSSGNL